MLSIAGTAIAERLELVLTTADRELERLVERAARDAGVELARIGVELRYDDASKADRE